MYKHDFHSIKSLFSMYLKTLSDINIFNTLKELNVIEVMTRSKLTRS